MPVLCKIKIESVYTILFHITSHCEICHDQGRDIEDRILPLFRPCLTGSVGNPHRNMCTESY